MWTMGRLDHRIGLKQVFKGLNQVTFHYFCHIFVADTKPRPHTRF